MASSKPLAPKSEGVDKDSAKNPRAVRLRAQDGRYRGQEFRWYLDDTESNILDLGTVKYQVIRSSDLNKWGLVEHLDPS